MADKVTASAYLVIVPEMSWDGKRVVGAKVDRHRIAKPSLRRGEVAVRVKLNFDAQALLDAIPVVEMDVTGFISPANPEVIATVDAN